MGSTVPGVPRLPITGAGAQLMSDMATWGLDPRFPSVLLTGGTGLIGRWVLSTLDSLNSQVNSRTRIHLISRDTRRAKRLLGEFATLDIRFADIDKIGSTIQRFHPDYIWHFAADTGSLDLIDPIAPFRADCNISYEICSGVSAAKYRPKILYTSSGAVYGRDSAPISPLEVESPIAQLRDYRSILYGHGKVTSEMLFGALNQAGLATVNIARLFAFVGPLMPIASHFALGNFLAAAVKREAIVLKSDGSAIRSWMYLGDLARILLLIAARSNSNIIDIGGEERCSILNAAQIVAEIAGVKVAVGTAHNPTGSSMEYLPNLAMLRSMGEVSSVLPLRAAIKTTYEWLVAEGGGFEPPRSLHP